MWWILGSWDRKNRVELGVASGGGGLGNRVEWRIFQHGAGRCSVVEVPYLEKRTLFLGGT